MNSVFITGTDTDAGKTVVSSEIIKAVAAQGRKAVGLKPIASGFDLIENDWRNADVDSLTNASNIHLPKERVNRYSFKAAIAPHIAASQTNESLDFNAIKDDVEFAKRHADFVLVEGVGGWHVPLSDIQKQPVADIEALAQFLEMPVVLVVGLRLGCINHAVLTAKSIVRSGAPFLGWVANHIEHSFDYAQENLESLEALLPAPKLFEVPYLKDGLNIDMSHIERSPFIQSLCR